MTAELVPSFAAVERRWRHPAVDEGWKDRAACADEEPSLWFPVEDGKRSYNREIKALTETARAICHRCPVQGECLGYALDLDLRFGMYGGLTEQERYKLTGRRPE